jgi:8-oxo-dGTP pyrophosphatase MutT (NUDIX family)
MVVTPKPASSVVLMDDSFRVYLTQRPKTMKFLGGYFVFPGGKVDKGDFDLDQRHLTKLSLDYFPHYSYYVAAARELFEEIGILLVGKENPKVMDVEKESEFRRLLINEEISFLEMLKGEGIQLDLTTLKYFGQIITPEIYPMRFDTRFFLAKLPERQIPKPHPREIEGAFWIHPEAALRNYENRDLQIASPTIHILKALVSLRKCGDLVMPEYNVSDYLI